MNAVRQKFDEMRMLFERLSGREKILVAAFVGGLLIIVVSLISLWIGMSLSKQKSVVETQRSSYERILGLKMRFEDAQKNLTKTRKGIDVRNATEANRVIGTLAEQYGLAVRQINQSQGSVDRKAGVREMSWKIDFSRTTLPALIQFLEGLEKSGTYFVKNINMKRRFDNKNEVDVSLNVSTLVPLDSDG